MKISKIVVQEQLKHDVCLTS